MICYLVEEGAIFFFPRKSASQIALAKAFPNVFIVSMVSGLGEKQELTNK